MARVRLSRDQASRGRLPACCMACGAPATTSPQKGFTRFPLWLVVVLFIQPLLCGLLALFVVRFATLHTPFCERHRDYWLWRSWLVWGGLAFLVCYFVGCFGILAVTEGNQFVRDDFAGPALGACGLFFWVWIITAVVVNRTCIRSQEITEEYVVLAGVSPRFVDAAREELVAGVVTQDLGGYPPRPGRPRRAEPDDRFRPEEDRIAE